MVSAMNDRPSWVTVTEAADLLGKSRRTIRRWATQAKLPSKDTPKGKLVDVSGHLAGSERPSSDVGGLQGRVATLTADVDNLTEVVRSLADERDYLRDRVKAQEDLLHEQNVIIQTMQMTKQKALPDPAKRRSWWKRFSGWIDPTTETDEPAGE